MNAKQFSLSTLLGGVILFLLGFLFYIVIFGNFFEANQGTATGVPKEAPDMWAIALGNLALAGLLTLVFGRWASISTFDSRSASLGLGLQVLRAAELRAEPLRGEAEGGSEG